jgi:hypothetical protein
VLLHAFYDLERLRKNYSEKGKENESEKGR